MVNLEIPTSYTHSPSSYNGTTQLTINREITSLDLDSSNAFEGPEKLLEVWFVPSEEALPASAAPRGLKAVSQETWKEMLDLVNCKVLSVVESQNVDAYLLSESSMFIFPHKLVLKTCGTTTLLCGLPRILEIAALEAGFPHLKANMPNGVSAVTTPHRVFYSRKNYLYPDQQRGPHRSWREEVRYLDRMFVGGSAYMIGKMNGEHWYLYITGPGTQLTPPSTPPGMSAENFNETPRLTTTAPQDGCDETLEILMTDLDVENARQFYLEDASIAAQANARRTYQARKDAASRLGVLSGHSSFNGSMSSDTLVADDAGFDVFVETSTDHAAFSSDSDDEALTFSEELTTEGHALGTAVTESCGLADLYPVEKFADARIDSYLFTPCGYSANGVVPTPGNPDCTHYWTVHVTPEPQCSYASFETNVPAHYAGGSTADILKKVVNIFKPGRFSVTLFEGKTDDEKVGLKKSTQFDKNCLNFVPGYRRLDRIVHDLDGYELIFRYFEREDWKGGAPRLGEHGF